MLDIAVEAAAKAGGARTAGRAPGKKAPRIRREEARLRSIGASLLLRAAGIEPPFACGEHGNRISPAGRIFAHAQRHASPRLP